MKNEALNLGIFALFSQGARAGQQTAEIKRGKPGDTWRPCRLEGRQQPCDSLPNSLEMRWLAYGSFQTSPLLSLSFPVSLSQPHLQLRPAKSCSKKLERLRQHWSGQRPQLQSSSSSRCKGLVRSEGGPVSSVQLKTGQDGENNLPVN